MIADKMKNMVANSSAIRAMFEEGTRLAGIYGRENVFDFSLGNPNVPAPQIVKDAIVELVNDTDPVVLHGYTNSNSGYPEVREAIAKSLNERFDTKFSGKNIVMTVGAAGGLNVILKSLINPGDEVIAFAPYFGEYRSYTNNYDGVLVEISPNTVDFQPKLDEFEQKITPKTKAVIVNTPNNPTGVVYSEETIKKVAAILDAKQKEYGTEIFIVSDEPYRELAYDGVEVPYITKYYNNTIVGYSFSKSLSLPGERIGYLVIPDEVDDAEQMKGEYENTLNSAKNQAADIVKDAKTRAEVEYNSIIEQGNKDAAAIMANADKTIAQEKERAIKQSKAEMADLAISMASKLVEKNVDATTNKKLIDDFLSEAGDTQ